MSAARSEPGTDPYLADASAPCSRRRGASDTACRCSADCRALATSARRARQDRQNRGTPGRVPGWRVRQHIIHILSRNPHLTAADIARAANVSRRSVGLLLNAPPERTVNLSTARKVLAVPLEIPAATAPGTRPQPGIGARRQVDALMVMGWPLAAIAHRAGLDTSTLAVRNLLPTAAPATIRAVEVVYLGMRYTLGPSDQTVERARRAGFVPWVAWEGRINDPHAAPVLTGIDPQWATACRRRLASLVADSG